MVANGAPMSNQESKHKELEGNREEKIPQEDPHAEVSVTIDSAEHSSDREESECKPKHSDEGGNNLNEVPNTTTCEDAEECIEAGKIDADDVNTSGPVDEHKHRPENTENNSPDNTDNNRPENIDDIQGTDVTQGNEGPPQIQNDDSQSITQNKTEEEHKSSNFQASENEPESAVATSKGADHKIPENLDANSNFDDTLEELFESSSSECKEEDFNSAITEIIEGINHHIEGADKIPNRDTHDIKNEGEFNKKLRGLLDIGVARIKCSKFYDINYSHQNTSKAALSSSQKNKDSPKWEFRRAAESFLSLFDSGQSSTAEKEENSAETYPDDDELKQLIDENEALLSSLNSNKGDAYSCMKYYTNLCRIHNIRPIDKLIQGTLPKEENDLPTVSIFCRDQQMTLEHSVIIKDVISVSIPISEIVFDNCSLQEISFRNITCGIEKNYEKLSKVVINRNPDICGISMSHMKRLLRRCPVTMLDMSRMELKMTGMIYLMDAVNMAENLESINLDYSDISENVLGLLVLQCKNCPPYKLSLRGNNFGTKAAPIIGCLLDSDGDTNRSKSLKILDLGNNNLNKSLHIFADLIAKNNTLISLSLSDNGILDQSSLKLIADALMRNRTLENFEFNNNYISSTDTYPGFSDVIKRNEVLKSLSLDKTNLNSSDLKNIAHAITINNTLQRLTLKNNNFSLATVKVLLYCMKVNDSLYELFLLPNVHHTCDDNMIEFAVTLNSIEEILKRNRQKDASEQCTCAT